ncbi:MAG: hypothetical protein U9P68_09840 [Pseudomonadota bacterium]|nr:hypothetical protein [Pseudomonadota bacterium]
MGERSSFWDIVLFFVLFPVVSFSAGAAVAMWQGLEGANSIQEALDWKWILIFGAGMVVAYVVAVFRTLVDILQRAFGSRGAP